VSVSAPTFTRDVAPLLATWCVSCHGPRHHHENLRLDDYAALLRGSDSGPVIEPGRAARSLLIAKIERRDRPPMPPRRRLPRAAIARLRAWIDAGAPE
jgi:hypothetical protein